MIKFITILLLLISITHTGFSQKNEVNFNPEIIKLNLLGRNIIESETNEKKYTANENYRNALKKMIAHSGSFNYSFDSLKTISILKANDLKIYNWALPLIDGTYEYFAFLQIKKSNGEYTLVELIDKSEKIKTPEYKILTTKNWYGALYYKLIHDKKLGENYYTILGWDGNNLLTNKKIIEVFNISSNGTVKIGVPIFKAKNNRKVKRRVIFEYGENVVMSLKYHPNIKTIIFDFLVPASSKLKGVYEYYGPALKIFDAFKLEKSQWTFVKDIDIKLDRNIKDNMWKDPKGE